MDEGGSVDEVSLSLSLSFSLSLSLSLKRLHGGALGDGAPSLGTVEDMLRRSLDADISLSMGAPLWLKGTRYVGGEGGLIYWGFDR
jgi:hypothetical protein